MVISYSRTSELVDEKTSLIQQGEEDQGDNVEKVAQAQYVEFQEWKVVAWMATFWKLLAVTIILYYWPGTWHFWHTRVPVMSVLSLLNLLILCHIRANYHIQPQRSPGFVCPGVPFTPALGIVVNLALFSALDLAAHLMTIAYFAVGAILYFGYGYFNSQITLRKQGKIDVMASRDNSACETESVIE